MATTAVKARNAKRKEMAAKYEARRAELKAAGDYEGLQKLPRNSMSIRVRSRCTLTGRGRGVYQKYGLCRNKFRELALEGKIPGVRKASW
ncbi:MAG: 30S ribosomal protein S14 [Candidatus Kapabacteria bacterium]|nr:30S ribosomal protein S14 [Candidatus Kapabacteria bacterium]